MTDLPGMTIRRPALPQPKRPPTRTFGQRMRLARKSVPLTQEDLGRLLGISPQSVAKWEADNGYPRADTLRRCCDFLDVSADWLLGRAE